MLTLSINCDHHHRGLYAIRKRDVHSEIKIGKISGDIKSVTNAYSTRYHPAGYELLEFWPGDNYYSIESMVHNHPHLINSRMICPFTNRWTEWFVTDINIIRTAVNELILSNNIPRMRMIRVDHDVEKDNLNNRVVTLTIDTNRLNNSHITIETNQPSNKILTLIINKSDDIPKTQNLQDKTTFTLSRVYMVKEYVFGIMEPREDSYVMVKILWQKYIKFCQENNYFLECSSQGSFSKILTQLYKTARKHIGKTNETIILNYDMK